MVGVGGEPGGTFLTYLIAKGHIMLCIVSQNMSDTIGDHRNWLEELINQSGWDTPGKSLEMPEHGWCWIGLYDFTDASQAPQVLDCIEEENDGFPEHELDALPNHHKFPSLYMKISGGEIPP
mgnify:CR=1 FL=1